MTHYAASVDLRTHLVASRNDAPMRSHARVGALRSSVETPDAKKTVNMSAAVRLPGAPRQSFQLARAPAYHGALTARRLPRLLQVLEAAERVARELRALQDEYILMNYKNG